MGPYNAGPNLTPAPLTPALIMPVTNSERNIKMSIFPLIMGIFVRKFKRKGYMLRMQCTKFRKNMVFPFQNGSYYAGPSNANATRKNNADIGPAL